MKILNAEYMRKSLVGKTRHVSIYNGKARDAFNKGMSDPILDSVISIKTEAWYGSEARARLLNERHKLGVKLMNAATGYDQLTLKALLAQTYVTDLDRLKDDLADYSPILLTERVDAEASEQVSLRNYLPYIGREGTVMGASDTVPLMDHNLPVDVIVTMEIKGFGDKTTFRELVLNPYYKTENVMQSAARILADGQNKESIGAIVGATYDAAHSQAADTTGATKDLQLYITVKAAIRKALALWNILTKKQNGLMAHKVYLLINPIDLTDIQPIIEGGLERLAGINQMVGRLPIDAIIPYGGGLNDGLVWGGETLSYPGVAAGTFYIMIKNDVYGGYKIIKRSSTMEMGDGDVLALTTEKRAWHRIDGTFLDWILPSAAGGKQYGAVIKGTFPS
jgi:hypothetical protein